MNLDALLKQADERDDNPGSLAEAHARLYGPELRPHVEAHASRMQEHGLLDGLKRGRYELKAKDFPFRGQRCRLSQTAELLKQVEHELQVDKDWLTNLDRDVFLVHHRMARGVADLADELENRYRFHLAVQTMLEALGGTIHYLEGTLAGMQGQREVPKEQFQRLLQNFNSAHNELYRTLERADQLAVPALKNIQGGEPLSRFLLNEPLVKPLNPKAQSLDGKWVGAFMQQLNAVRDRTRRIHFKSLGGILALQERIAEGWFAVNPVVATGSPD